MAYTIISQNNTTTTLADENGNVITVPARVTLATSTDYTIIKVNNNSVDLEDGDGKIIRGVPACVVLAGEGGGGGGDSHNKGYYATQAALEEAYPTGEAGDYAIVGSTDTVWLWDEDTSAWVDGDTKGQVVSVNSKTGTVVLTAEDVDALPQYTTVPAASSTNAGEICQFIGTTGATYTNGYFYKNVATTTPSSATASQTTGSSLTDVAVVVATFETQITTSGSYVFTSDGADWSYDGNVVDLTDYGITYTGTPVADDAITVVYTAESTSYAWTRIDVQPTPVIPDPLPSQTGNSGKFLTTDGTDASWSDKPLVNLANDTSQGVGIVSGDVYGFSVAIGKNSKAGRSNDVLTSRSTAVGVSAKATYNNNKHGGTALGYYAEATGDFSVALGASQKATADNAIQIGTNNATNSDANTFKVANANGNFEIMSADGTVPADRLAKAINKYSSMPTASADNLGWIVQYTGTTDATYTHGYIYECVSDGGNPATYSWTAVQVQAGSGGLPSQTGQSGKFLTTDGTDASWSDKPLVNTATGSATIAIGTSASVSSPYAVVIGGLAPNATGTSGGGIAIGRSATVYNGGIAIGQSATTNNSIGIAIGQQAKINAVNAIQIGVPSQTNSDANTFKVANENGNFELMNANGNLPADRLASTSGLADGNHRLRLVMASGVPTLEWVAE